MTTTTTRKRFEVVRYDTAAASTPLLVAEAHTYGAALAAAHFAAEAEGIDPGEYIVRGTFA